MIDKIPLILRRHHDLTPRAKAFRGLAWALTIPLGLPALIFWAFMVFVVIPLFVTTGGAILAGLQAMVYVFLAAILPWALFLWPLNVQFRAELEGKNLHRAWAVCTALVATLFAVGALVLLVAAISILDNAAWLGISLAGSLIAPFLVFFGVQILSQN